MWRMSLPTPFVGRPVDEFIKRPPENGLAAKLLVRRPRANPAAPFVPSALKPLITRSGNLVFPRLRAPLPDQPWTDEYRVVVTCAGLTPLYTAPEGFAFQLSATSADARVLMPLLPTGSYQYPAYLPVARGIVRKADEAQAGIVAAVGMADRSLTDERGRFSLCLRAAPSDKPVTIDFRSSDGHVLTTRTFPTPVHATRSAVLVDIP